MAKIPNTGDAPLVRTDYSDNAAWNDILTAIRTPSADGFLANLCILDDPSFDGMSAELIGQAVQSSEHAVAFVADKVAMTQQDRAVLCLDAGAPDQMFRAVPSELWSVENNLSLANMDFEEFGEAAGADGVFRGF